MGILDKKKEREITIPKDITDEQAKTLFRLFNGARLPASENARHALSNMIETRIKHQEKKVERLTQMVEKYHEMVILGEEAGVMDILTAFITLQTILIGKLNQA